MVLNNSLFCTIITFIILSILRGEAHNTSPPVAKKANQKDSSDCAATYIKAHMEDTAAKCKEFVEKEIMRRLQDPNLAEKDIKCLISCSAGYLAGIGSLTKGITDVSAGLYIGAIEDIVAFSTAIAPCMLCTAEITFIDPEFREFQKWARRSAEDLQNKLKSCINL